MWFETIYKSLRCSKYFLYVCDHSRYVLAEDYCGDGRGTFMVTAENVPCGAEAVSCTKSIKFTIHDTGLSLYLELQNIVNLLY